MNCLTCRSKLQFPKKTYCLLICSECSSEYLVVESIPIMVNDDSDFYRYKRKLRRIVQIKNEQSKN